MKWTSWLALTALALLVTFVVYSSLRLGRISCEVCIAYRGRQSCRTVEGADEDDARRAAINNTCAQLAAGVTDTMACERTPPSRVECGAL